MKRNEHDDNMRLWLISDRVTEESTRGRMQFADWQERDVARLVELDLEAATAMFVITSRKAATRTEYDGWDELDKVDARRTAKAILRASGIRDLDDED